MNPNKLQEHIFSTYITLRYGIAVVALAFPVLLYVVGRFHGISLQDSMSHYYFALSPDDLTERIFPMRVWFVGILFAIGIFLYLYKGFSTKENVALNLAGIFALGVALFPMELECGDACRKINPHGISAVSLFLCIAFVSLRCARETLHLVADTHIRAKFRRQYQLLGFLMLASPITALFFTLALKNLSKYTFFIEAAGVWAFALYWLRKSQELSQTGAEKLALRAEIET